MSIYDKNLWIMLLFPLIKSKKIDIINNSHDVAGALLGLAECSLLLL